MLLSSSEDFLMKKYVTLRNCMKCLAAVLGIVAFFLFFAPSIKLGGSGLYAEVSYQDYFFGDGGAILPFLGHLFILLGALGACALIFLKLDKTINLICVAVASLLMVVGAVFIFVGPASYINVNGIRDAADYVKMMASPIFAGIFGALGGSLVCGSNFIQDKAFLK